MTAQPETRFKCDRCTVEINVVLANTPARMLPPEGWMTLRLDDLTTTPPTHLCPGCTEVFEHFMSGKPL